MSQRVAFVGRGWQLGLLVILCLGCGASETQPAGSGTSQEQELILVPLPGPIPYPPPTLSLVEAARDLRKRTDGVPTSFEIWRSVESTPDTFFSRAAESFQLVSSDAMVKKVEVAGRDGLRHTRFQLSSNGIPVEGALYTLTSRGSRVISGVGHLVPGLNISPLPAVSEATALATAKAAVGASQWAWEVDASEPPPVGQKVAFSEDFGRSKPYRLAWKFLLRAWQPQGLWYVWVDAGSGQVMARRSALRQADTLASGKDFLGHDVTFRSQADASGYVLREGDLRKISTLRRTKTGDLDYLDTDNVWTEAEHARPVSAHVNAERFWDYLENLVGWKGLDGLGTAGAGITLQVEPQGNCDGRGPYWDPYALVVNLCGVLPTDAPHVDLETVGHELTHSLITLAGNDMVGSDENTGIEEGIADVLGNAVSVWWYQNPNDWTLYEQGSPPELQRSLSNPKSHGLADTYKSALWMENVEIAREKQDMHQLSGVLVRWYYLLAAGGSGQNDLGQVYSVTGIGRLDAEHILWSTLPRLNAASDYPVVREASLLAAREHFGDDSIQLASVAAAWDAVGVIDTKKPPVTKYRQPAWGAANVEPWPAYLTFQTPLGTPRGGDPSAIEWQWRVELATNEAFTEGLQSAYVSSQMAQGNIIVSRVSFVLKAHQVYYWRVKANRSPGGWDTNWNFTSKFQTSGKAPRNVKPFDRQGNVHPWPFKPSWSAVPGAVSYQMQVTTSNFSSNVLTDSPTSTSSSAFKLPVRTPHLWRVRARGPDGGGYGEWSTLYHGDGENITNPDLFEEPWQEPLSLSFYTADAVPGFLQPANGATVYPWQLKLSWAKNGASAYEYQLATSTRSLYGMTPVWVAAPLQGNPSVVKNLAPNTQYYWRVRARGYADDVSNWSATYSFRTNDAAPRFITPANGAKVAPWPVNFTWEPVPGAQSYTFELSKANTPDFASATSILTGASSTSVARAVTDGNLTYYWRVRATGPGGVVGGWSNQDLPGSQSFQPNQSTSVTYVSPYGPNIPVSNVLFKWQAEPGAVGYVVELNENNPQAGFPLVTSFTTTASTLSRSLTGPLAYGKDYIWTLYALGPDNTEGVRSYASFTTVPAPTPPVKACNSDIINGANDPAKFTIELGKASGNTALQFNFFTVPDRLILRYEGNVLRDTGCTGGVGDIYPISYSGNSTQVEVELIPNCAGTPNTEWRFYVACP